jgi:hypothetical protein
VVNFILFYYYQLKIYYNQEIHIFIIEKTNVWNNQSVYEIRLNDNNIIITNELYHTNIKWIFDINLCVNQISYFNFITKNQERNSFMLYYI